MSHVRITKGPQPGFPRRVTKVNGIAVGGPAVPIRKGTRHEIKHVPTVVQPRFTNAQLTELNSLVALCHKLADAEAHDRFTGTPLAPEMTARVGRTKASGATDAELRTLRQSIHAAIERAETSILKVDAEAVQMQRATFGLPRLSHKDAEAEATRQSREHVMRDKRAKAMKADTAQIDAVTTMIVNLGLVEADPMFSGTALSTAFSERLYALRAAYDAAKLRQLQAAVGAALTAARQRLQGASAAKQAAVTTVNGIAVQPAPKPTHLDRVAAKDPKVNEALVAAHVVERFAKTGRPIVLDPVDVGKAVGIAPMATKAAIDALANRGVIKAESNRAGSYYQMWRPATAA